MKTIFQSILNTGAVIALLVLPLSCNDFLSKQPSKDEALPITTIGQLDAILSTYRDFASEPNQAAIAGHDDFGFIPELYDASASTYSMPYIQAGLWDYENLAMATRDNFWTGEYSKIFRANMVLGALNKVSGSDQDKTRLSIEAHFIRAYSYWVLANTYCLPYTEQNKAEPGLPIKTATGFEQSLDRGTLEQTYQLIEADLNEALKCVTPLLQDGEARNWRANTAGIHGFAARYYLHRNNYAKALEYANAVLEECGELIDYNTDMRYGKDGSATINAGTSQQESVTIKYPYTRDNTSNYTDRINWKEHLYMRFLEVTSWYFIPSKDLLALYDTEHDLRYRYHIVEHYSYTRGATKPPYDYPGYVFFSYNHIPSGPGVAEMYLIKAECQARTGDYAAAISTLNALRAKRMEPGEWVNLSAADKDEAIRKILEERRRELPFCQRWYDLRRYNSNEDPNDDVVVSRTFYRFDASMVYKTEAPITYTLEKQSRKYAAPILDIDIRASKGEIKQNTY